LLGDQVDDVGVLDEEKIEAPNKDNPGNADITITSTFANEGWTVVRKKKTSHATSQPMVTRSQARKLAKSASSSPTS
jgi:hypothetical protein